MGFIGSEQLVSIAQTRVQSLNECQKISIFFNIVSNPIKPLPDYNTLGPERKLLFRDDTAQQCVAADHSLLKAKMRLLTSFSWGYLAR